MSWGHVVSVSSGAPSAYLWWLVMQEHGPGDVVALFCDVNGEDEDNYRFLNEVHPIIGGELVWLDNDGRTIWDVFRDERFLGNTRVDICSRVLKREPAEAWIKEHAPDATLHLGIDWTEANRYEGSPATADKPAKKGSREHYAEAGIRTAAWLIERHLDKSDAIAWCESIGVEPPLLTRMGYPHANCKGGCVKAGHGQFKRLLRERPEAFAEWEREEQRTREVVGDFAILRDRTGGGTRPMPLRELRRRLSLQPSLFDDAETMACSCFTDWDD